jgi:hypothetical protein
VQKELEGVRKQLEKEMHSVCTLIPEPWNLNPAPSTLNPEP